VVASLAVFAWSEGDVLKHLTAAAARGATVQVLDAGLEIGPGSGAEALHQAVEAFAAARKRQVETERGRTGAMISARKREDRARTAAESIRAAWARRDIKTHDLLVHAGITLNTAKRYLGSRPIAQKARDASVKRQAGYLKAKQ